MVCGSFFYVQHERSMRRSLPGFAEGAVASHVRFTPESGHVQCTRACLLWAKSGHRAVLSDHLVRTSQ